MAEKERIENLDEAIKGNKINSVLEKIKDIGPVQIWNIDYYNHAPHKTNGWKKGSGTLGWSNGWGYESYANLKYYVKVIFNEMTEDDTITFYVTEECYKDLKKNLKYYNTYKNIESLLKNVKLDIVGIQGYESNIDNIIDRYNNTYKDKIANKNTNSDFMKQQRILFKQAAEWYKKFVEENGYDKYSYEDIKKELKSKFPELTDTNIRNVLFRGSFEPATESLEEELSNQQIDNIRFKLSNITNYSAIVNLNGYFTINNVRESDVNRVIQNLQNSDIVAYVNKTAGRFDFRNAFKASQGNPDRYWTVQGKLKENLNDDLNEEIEIHDTLNPKIWNEDNSLKDVVKIKIENIVDTFADILREDGIDLKIEDIYLLGSNANYNYTDESDLDIHIIADESFDCDAKHLPIIYQAYKALFNLKYDIKIKGINVELYVENKDDLSNVSTGVYSFNDGWIKDPAQYERPEIDDNKLNADINRWKVRAQKLLTDPSVDSIEKYIDDIYDLRTESISNEGEFGIGNLVFKEIRRQGILDNLKDLKFKLLSKELSLESLEESLEPELYHGTTVKNAFLILQEDTLKVGKMYGNKEPAVCFTRHLDNINSYKFAAIFVIDRDKLKAHYKITPITDYKNVVGDNHGARYTATDLVHSKAEEVVKKDITNIRKYIKKILIASDIIDVFKDYCKKNNVDISDLIIEEI